MGTCPVWTRPFPSSRHRRSNKKVSRNIHNLNQAFTKQLLALGAKHAEKCLLRGGTELTVVLGFGNGKLHGHGLVVAVTPRDTELIKETQNLVLTPAPSELQRRHRRLGCDDSAPPHWFAETVPVRGSFLYLVLILLLPQVAKGALPHRRARPDDLTAWF